MVPNADAEQWGPHQLLSMAARLIQRRQDQALAELGLTHAAVIALQGLAAVPLNQEQLAEDIHVRSQSLGRVLVRLEDAGLVSRKSSPMDRRSNEVAITEAGLGALAAARQVEKETLPPDIVEGTVLSRELARVIGHFPGSARFGERRGKTPPEGAETPAEDAVGEAGPKQADDVTAPGDSSQPDPGRAGSDPSAVEAADDTEKLKGTGEN